MKTKSIFSALMSVIFLQSPVQAQSIWVKAPFAPLTEYTAFMNVHPSYVRFSDFIIDQLKEQNLGAELTRSFERAQRSYLSQSQTIAIAHLKEVAHFPRSWPMSDTQRTVIHYAFLRLAQIDSSNKENYFSQAAAWSLEITPDPEVFAPPFIKEYQEYVSKLNSQSIRLFDHFPDLSWLLVNGQLHAVQPGQRLHLVVDAPMDWTLIAEDQEPIHLQATWQELSHQVRKPQYLLSGNCRSQQWLSTKWSLDHFEVFTGNQCLESDQKKSPQQPLQLAQLKPSTTSLQPTSANDNLSRTITSKKSSFSTVLNSEWFWIGAGVATLITILIAHSNNSGSGGGSGGEPTSTKEPDGTGEPTHRRY